MDAFFRLLALCHTVQPETINGRVEYQAQSPDEKALADAARFVALCYSIFACISVFLTFRCLSHLLIYAYLTPQRGRVCLRQPHKPAHLHCGERHKACIRAAQHHRVQQHAQAHDGTLVTALFYDTGWSGIGVVCRFLAHFVNLVELACGSLRFVTSRLFCAGPTDALLCTRRAPTTSCLHGSRRSPGRL